MEIMERLAETWLPDPMNDPGKIEKWVDLFADDIVLVEPESLPHGGRHWGLEAFSAVQAAMGELWDQRIVDVDYWQGAENLVTLRIVIRWTAWATGRSVVLPMIDLITFRDGKIAEIEVFLLDTKAVLDTLE